jgi:hypothetical protein
MCDITCMIMTILIAVGALLMLAGSECAESPKIIADCGKAACKGAVGFAKFIGGLLFIAGALSVFFLPGPWVLVGLLALAAINREKVS